MATSIGQGEPCGGTRSGRSTRFGRSSGHPADIPVSRNAAPSSNWPRRFSASPADRIDMRLARLKVSARFGEVVV
jgi:hypothetical protein